MNTDEFEHLLWLLAYTAAVGTNKALPIVADDNAIEDYRNSVLYNEDPNPPEEWVDEDVPF